MKKFLLLALIGVLVVGAGFVQAEKNITVQSMPPSVVSTFPQAGATSVDPAITEIKVTFSKEMMTKDMWSWVTVSEETSPLTDGQARYLDDKKTCVAPVSLEPGKTYVVWINSKEYNAFRDTDNNPAVPYLLAFQTRE